MYVQASVRVGQAVETVGQAGRPKTITGFQVRISSLVCAYVDVFRCCISYVRRHVVHKWL